jgi:hypothetical protein
MVGINFPGESGQLGIYLDISMKWMKLMVRILNNIYLIRLTE